jgi:hypothetical protein
MARFSTGIYHLFAVLAALAVLANALPAPAQNPAAMESMGEGVAGQPGLGAVFANKKPSPTQMMPDMNDDMVRYSFSRFLIILSFSPTHIY